VVPLPSFHRPAIIPGEGSVRLEDAPATAPRVISETIPEYTA